MADKKPTNPNNPNTPVRPATSATAATSGANITRPGVSSTLRRETAASRKPQLPLFEKENYMWMIIGAVVIAIGMLLMAGGKNTDANQFDYSVVYSTTRVTIAPILIILGLGIEIFAIFKRPKAHTTQ